VVEVRALIVKAKGFDNYARIGVCVNIIATQAKLEVRNTLETDAGSHCGSHGLLDGDVEHCWSDNLGEWRYRRIGKLWTHVSQGESTKRGSCQRQVLYLCIVIVFVVGHEVLHEHSP
jgi:hypothetical protein